MFCRNILKSAFQRVSVASRPVVVIAAMKFPVLHPNVATNSKIGHICSFHSSVIACGKVKTKKAAAKRFLKTGKGDLKYGKAGKRHLNKHKSRTRVSRLGEKGILEGVWAKKMKILLPY